MKKIVSLLFLITLSLSIWSEPAGNACKIKVVKTEKGVNIIAASKNVYVRKPGNGDNKFYVFASDTIVEFVCDTLETAPIINLRGGNKEGVVSCWSKEFKESAIEKKDPQESHRISPTKRRNWLKFNSMNASTCAVFTIESEGQTATIDIRQCGGWTSPKASIRYQISNIGTSPDQIFKMQGDSLISPILKLKEGEKLTSLTLDKNATRCLAINGVTIDGKYVPFKVTFEHTTDLKEDDIMYNTQIEVDTTNIHLESGTHMITFMGTALTGKGPKDVRFYVPVEIEEVGMPISIGIIIGCIFVIFALLLFFMRKTIVRWIFRSKNVKKKSSPKSDDVTKGHEGKEVIDEPFTTKGDVKDINKEEKIGGDEVQKAEGTSRELPQSYISEEDVKEIKKKVLREVINKWNRTHTENPVGQDQMNIEPLITVIERGYISKSGRTQLLSALKEYGIRYDDDISATNIADLMQALLNKGAMEARNLPNAVEKQLREQNRLLSETKTRLEGEKQQLVKECAALREEKVKQERDKNKLKKDFEELSEDNVEKIELIEKQEKFISELKCKLDNQSQEHVAELGKQIMSLKAAINEAKRIISEKEAEIEFEKKNAINAVKKKEEWEAKFRTVDEKLKVADGNHKVEIDKLKSDHEIAKRQQKEKYEDMLVAKDKEIGVQKSEYEKRLDAQKALYEEKLQTQIKAADNAQLNLKNEHAAEIDLLNQQHAETVNKFKATIKELDASVNVGRDETINKAEKLLKAVIDDLETLSKTVNSIIDQSPIFVNSIKNILEDLKITEEAFNNMKDSEWNEPEKMLADVIADMQDIFIEALGKSGWINNVARLHSYSRLPVLQDGTDLPRALEEHGISSSVMERIYANMLTLLGTADMGIILPAVLANNYSKDNYEYKNADTWINQFFPEVSTRNYKGKVFDIVQVGYTIGGKTESNPVVQYN